MGVEVAEKNYAKLSLSVDEVRAIVRAAGSVAAVLNTRHAVAKAKGWVTAPPSEEDYARAVVGEPNLLRRPVLLVGEKGAATAIVGFDREAYARLSP
jgi:arsenate reductase-like glutaredoxin family protein